MRLTGAEASAASRLCTEGSTSPELLKSFPRRRQLLAGGTGLTIVPDEPIDVLYQSYTLCDTEFIGLYATSYDSIPRGVKIWV